ncbi:MAG: Dihydroneopterin aldolase [Bacteroidota bacterium]|jgi:dihydroneopterin aldolase
MGIIEIEQMEFYAYHGCFAEERIVGNKFRVDLRLEADCRLAAQTDAITDAVNYQTAYDVVKAEIAIPSHLLEHICQRILDSLYAQLPSIQKATVRVYKMNPPMGGEMRSVSVSMTR